MPSHVENLLTSLGIPAEDATKIIGLPEADTFDSKPYTEKVKSNYQTQFKNDPDFFSSITIENLPPEVKKKIEATQFGRAAKITTEKLLKGLGMTEADYADLPDEQKEKIELLIPAIAERYTKTKAGDKQLQADLIEARKKLEGYGPDYEIKIQTQYEAAANNKIKDAIFNASVIGELSSIPGLKIPASDIAGTANGILQSKYGFERVNDYTVELRQKANPQMKVLKEGSSKELSLKDALIDIATERGWIEDKKEDGKGSGKIQVTPGKDGNLHMIPPHLQGKISTKIAAEA